MTTKILCVDDEPNVLRGLRRQLYDKFDVEFAEGPERALEMLETAGPFAIVLADMRMPVMDGALLLAEIRSRSPDTVRMMLTGNSDLLTAIRAVNEGNIFRFLNKPCAPDDLERALRDGLEQFRLISAEKVILEETLNGCVKVLTEILAIADPKGFQHANELKELAQRISVKLELPRPWELQMAVMLAQLGRVAVPPETLAKAEAGESLSHAERGMMASIPSAGAELIENIPRLDGVAEIVRRQAEDCGVKCDQGLPEAARVLRVLQEMMRLEDAGLDRIMALAGMEEDAGFDSEVVGAVASCLGIGLASAAGTRQISFEGMRPGDVLAAPLVTVEGRMIVGKGQRIGQVLLGRLRNHQQIGSFREPIHIENRESGGTVQARKSA